MENYEKKYKEALCWIRKIYPTMNGCDKEDAERHFPELKESEGEMIRKELIEKVKETPACIGFNDKNAVIAWLEKQGEEARNIALRTEYEKGRADAIAEIQKSDNKIIPIFRVGDVIKRKNGNGYTVIVSQVDTQYQCYCYKAWDGAATNYCAFSFEEQDEWELAEQKPAWSEKDEKMLKETLAFIETVEDINKAKDGFLDVKMWLKSLKDKCTISEALEAE